MWECGGCGTFYTDAQVNDATVKEKGSGGVRRVYGAAKAKVQP